MTAFDGVERLREAAKKTDDRRAKETLNDLARVLCEATLSNAKRWVQRIEQIIPYVLAGNYCGSCNEARKLFNRRSFDIKLANLQAEPPFVPADDRRLACCTFFYRNSSLDCELHRVHADYERLITPEISREINAITSEILRKPEFQDSFYMREFCRPHCAPVQSGNDMEWNAYLSGEHLAYYMRFSFFPGGYPLKMHCYMKGCVENG